MIILGELLSAKYASKPSHILENYREIYIVVMMSLQVTCAYLFDTCRDALFQALH